MRYSTVLFAVFVLFIVGAQCGFLTIKNGYFYDEEKQEAWLAAGFSYQTWIADLGEWPSNEQLEWDVREMKKMGANSLRVDFVWKHIEEEGDNIFQWDRYDHLIKVATKYDMKVFALIGYQWPPEWFPGNPFTEGDDVDPGWYTKHPASWGPAPPFEPIPVNYTQEWVSDIISFENQKARAQFQEFLKAVGNRYKDETAIAGWVIGNEYGYIGLWSYRQDGFDPACIAAFQNYLQVQYTTITALNAKWKTSYASFSEVQMPTSYDRDSLPWGDLIQWRESSVAGYLGSGAAAIKSVDKNHLISYTTVGMIWGPEDWRYHAEDTRKIAEACAAAGAPLDFWSINNYPNGMAGDELRTGRWGFAFGKWNTKLPVLLTETGFTGSENLFPVFTDQGVLLNNALWDAFMAGSMGVHIFHWSDRDWLTTREKGFGIISNIRTPKVATPIVTKTLITFQQLNLTKLFYASPDTKKNIGFFWTNATDQMHNRYQANMQGIWGPLERLGFEPTFLDGDDLRAGLYKGLYALILPRNKRMNPGDLQYIYDHVIPAGVHVMADADLPGVQRYDLVNNTDFDDLMAKLFGIKAIQIEYLSNVVTEYVYGVNRERIDVVPKVDYRYGLNTSRPTDIFYCWQYHKIEPLPGTTLYATFRSGAPNEYWANEYPAAVGKDHGTAKTWINAFALGDLLQSGSVGWGALPNKIPWEQHNTWFGGIFLSPEGFGIVPPIRVDGSPYIQVDARNTSDGRTLISVMNWSDNTTESVVITIPEITGKNLRNLFTGQLIESPTDGIWSVTLEHNEFFMYIADSGPAALPFIIINEFPLQVWPNNYEETVSIHYDAVGSIPSGKVSVLLEFVNVKTGDVYSSNIVTGLPDSGDVDVNILIPLAKTIDPTYISSIQGGEYHFRASVMADGTATALATTEIYTRLGFSTKPTAALPKSVTTDPVKITAGWEELPELSRKQAFFGRVAIYYSTKTASIDWAHGEKAWGVQKWLEDNGYVFAYLGPLEEPKKMKGKVYYMVSDDMICDNGLCGSTTLDKTPLNMNTHYLSTYFDTVIFPGVWVMSDEEVANFREFLRKPDSKVITTEGGVGIYTNVGKTYGGNRLADVFGFDGKFGNIYEVVDYPANISVITTSHPTTRDYVSGTKVGVEVRVGAKIYTKPTTAVPLGKFTVDKKDFPALLYNSYYNASIFTFNYDVTTNDQLINKTALKPLAARVVEWNVLSNQICKMRWILSDTATEEVLAVDDIWIPTETGTSELVLHPTKASSAVTWTGFTFFWNATNPVAERIGYYSTTFDVVNAPSVVVTNSLPVPAQSNAPITTTVTGSSSGSTTRTSTTSTSSTGTSATTKTGATTGNGSSSGSGASSGIAQGTTGTTGNKNSKGTTGNKNNKGTTGTTGSKNNNKKKNSAAGLVPTLINLIVAIAVTAIFAFLF